MGITKRKDGYYVQFRVIGDGKVLNLAPGNPSAKMKRWKTGTFKKTLAKEQAAKYKTDLMMGKIKCKRTESITFREWGEIYLSLEAVKNLSSYKERVNAVRLQFIPFFKNVRLSDISVQDIEAYRAQRVKRNGQKATMGTINNDHTILKHMLSLAEGRGLIEGNVAKRVPLPNPNNARDRVLTDEEWRQLYDSASLHLQPILLIAYDLGLRLGEILQLSWERVDLQRRFIQLRSQDTKTQEARMVPMTPAVYGCLLNLSKVRSLVTNHVFLYEGKPIKGIKRGFQAALRRAKIEDFRFHDLRHCAATNLRRNGVDTITAMRIVGHKSEHMHKRYNHVSESDLLAAASKINTYVTPAQSSETSITASC